MIKRLFKFRQNSTVKLNLSATPALTTQPDDEHMNLAGLVLATQINMVVKGSQAQELGVQAGDIIASLGNIQWPTWADIIATFNPQSENYSQDASLNMSVLRDGKIIAMGIVLPSRGKLGVGKEFAPNHAIVSRVLEGSPFTPLKLTPGSVIKSINSTPVSNIAQLQMQLQKAAAASEKNDKLDVFIGYELNVKDKPIFANKVTFEKESITQLAEASWALPLDLIQVFGPLKVRVQAQSPLEAVKLGITKTHQFMLQTYITLARLFQGSVKAQHLRGPVGIIDEGQRIAKQGWPYLMFFLGLISVNLVVINFLPLPIVDGGLMVFLIIEKIKGSPVSAKIQSASVVVGLLMIATIFLVTLFYDVSRIEMFQNLFNKLF